MFTAGEAEEKINVAFSCIITGGRIDYGPGYRVYYTMRRQTVLILLAGGDKRTQAADIKTALQLARNL